MSDNGLERPLTRKERRLLETQQFDAIGNDEQPSVTATADSNNGNETLETDTGFTVDESLIDIPTVDADGNPLTRREVRYLREEAIEAQRETYEAQLGEEARLNDQAQLGEEPQEQSESNHTDGSSDFDAQDVSTQALSVEELQEIEQDAQTAEQAEASVHIEAGAPDVSNEPTDVAETFEQILPGSDDEPAIVENELSKREISAEEPETALPVDDQLAAVEPDSDNTDEPVEPEAAETAYSFPDIKPLEIDRPVFDDPSVRTVGIPSGASQGTGFEDMIERAVADESASVHTGTSSLILPTIPGSDDLSGAIGATGELFITGSFELPKSIGETGGHSKLQDLVEGEYSGDDEAAVEMLNLTDIYETSEFDSAPVSASRAVSTRSIDKSGITTPEVKHDNKKSLILWAPVAELILVLIGAGIWVAKSGLFG